MKRARGRVLAISVVVGLVTGALLASPALGDRNHVEYPDRCRREFRACVQDCSDSDAECQTRCRDQLNECVDW